MCVCMYVCMYVWMCVCDLLVNASDYQISIEKFEPEPGFEPRTSGFLARRSTT